MTWAEWIALLASMTLSAWLFYKQTERLLRRYKNHTGGMYNDLSRENFNRWADALGKVETRLVRPLRPFAPADGKTVWLIVFSYNRKSLLLSMLADLRRLEPTIKLLIIDNGSADGTIDALNAEHQNNQIQKLLLNQHRDVPHWQKGFALAQALQVLALEKVDYIGWIDDDMRIKKPFIETSIKILHDLAPDNVRLVSFLTDDTQEKNHPTQSVKNVDTEPVKIQSSFSGAFVMAHAAFFEELGLPPVAEGIADSSVEDWYYSRLMQARGYKVAAIDVADHLGYKVSIREAVEKTIADTNQK
jgi:glycosyltransferase involved in cell wall biosynthesis